MTGTKFSRTEARLLSALRSAIALLLIAPFMIWLARLSEWSWPQPADWLPALRASCWQASVSTLWTLLFGFVLYRGLASLAPGRRALAEGALLLPNLMPPLFLALSLLSWAPFIGGFPFGGGAVVFAHILLNSGLAALAFDRLVRDRMAGLADAAWVMGASAPMFFREVAWPYLRRDILIVATFLFSLHFTSFSLPLLLAGDRTVTLEVAIFDAIRVEGRWDLAVFLAAVQALFLLLLSTVVGRPFWRRLPARERIPFFAAPAMRVLVFVPAVLLIAGWLMGQATSSVAGWEPGLWNPVITGAITSLILGLATGLFHLVLLLLIALSVPHASFERFLGGYLAPSPAITGFALLLLPIEGETARILLCALALTLISLPLLYRWQVAGALAELKAQMQTARTLGAGRLSILFEIVWPQAAPSLLRASGLGALWASGDFALSGILLGPDATLPLVMEGLLSHYRLESASLLLLPLALIGLALYGLFTGVRRYVVG